MTWQAYQLILDDLFFTMRAAMKAKTQPRSSETLTPRMSRFVSEYLVDLNATQAAIRAGYSRKTARQIAAENLTKPVISAEIRMRLDIRKRELKIDADWFLQCLLDDKDADMRDLFDENNRLRPPAEWPLIWRQGRVRSVKMKDVYGGTGPDRVLIGQNYSISFFNCRMRILEMIGNHVSIQAFKHRADPKQSDVLAELHMAITGRSIRPVEKSESIRG